MTARFKSEYEYDGFYERGDLLRPKFGLWDACDPVAEAILDLVEAQNELADLFDEAAAKPHPPLPPGTTYEQIVAGEFNDLPGEQVMFKAAVHKRHMAGEKLMHALPDRQNWPDPKLGAR